MTALKIDPVSHIVAKASRIDSAARQSGTEVVSTKLRKEAIGALGALYRALMKIRLSDRYEDLLADIEKDIKTCDHPAEMVTS